MASRNPTSDPALQGGVAYSHEHGFYAGIWGSNVDFFDESAAGANPAFDNRANYELDCYAGFIENITESIEWDISLYLYTYPGADRNLLRNSEELFLGVRFKNINIQLSRDFDNKNAYFGTIISFPIMNESETSLHAGHYSLNGLINYNDYSITITKQFNTFAISAVYTDTDMNSTECIDYSGYSNLCDSRFSMVVSKDF